MNNAIAKKIMNSVSVLGILATLAITIYFIHLGVFQDQNALRGLVGERIILGPILFVFIQIIQVVVPIIPGGISNAAGVLIFGPVAGFIYNYVGNVIGSLILFSLGRKYGKPFIQTLVNEKTYQKYVGKLENKKWDTLFTILIAAPIAPDDALVLMTSLTKMSFKKLSLIILLAKPFSIAAYSLILVYGGQYLTNLLIN